MKRTFSVKSLVDDVVQLDSSIAVMLCEETETIGILLSQTYPSGYQDEPLQVRINCRGQYVQEGRWPNGDPRLILDLSTREVMGLEVVDYYDFQVSNLEVTQESITAVVDFGEGQPKPIKVSISTTPDEVTVALEAL